MAQAIGQTDEGLLLRRIRERLAANLGKRIYEMWFAQPERLELRFGRLVVSGQNEFEINRLRRNYDDALQSVVREFSFPPMAVDYELNTAAIDPPSSSSTLPPPPDETLPLSSNGNRLNLVERGATKPVATTEPKRRRHQSLADFVFGESNEMLRAALAQVTQQPGSCSPLILVGPTGCGKTHALSGLVAKMCESSKFGRCAYFSAEEFTNSFLDALRGSGLPSFRRKYRDLQMLAIDDFQFLGGKRATLTEFQYTLDHLTRAGKQVVLASDRPPSQIVGIGEELLTRLTCGWVCSVIPLDTTARRTLIERGAARRDLPLSDDVVHLLAQNLPGDARRIQGALNRLQAWQLCRRQVPSLRETRELLRDLLYTPTARTTLARIEQAVCDCCGVEADELHSESRGRRIAAARMLAMWLSRRHTSNALADIGRHFGGRSHSSVIAAQKKIDQWLKSEDESLFAGTEGSLRDVIQQIEQRLKVG